MDLRALLDSFYDKLILRDLVGKVVPGIAFIVALISGLIGLDVLGQLMTRMTTFVWVVVIGFAWLLAFALQGLGEITTVLRTHPRGRRLENERYRPLKPPWTRHDFYRLWANFHKVASTHEKIHAERLNVIKEACGNATVSMASAVAFAGVGVWLRSVAPSSVLPFGVIGLLIAGLLWRMHIEHVERYGEFVVDTIEFHKENPDQPNEPRV